MKKVTLLIMLCACLLFTGCNNSFAKREYNSNEKIAESEDRYAKESSVFNPIEGGYFLQAHKFDGRETLWSETLDKNKDIEVEIRLGLSEGSAKIVHVDENGNVATLAECTPPEAMTDIEISKTVSLTSGLNKIKIVGKDCVDLDLEILSSDF